LRSRVTLARADRTKRGVAKLRKKPDGPDEDGRFLVAKPDIKHEVHGEIRGVRLGDGTRLDARDRIATRMPNDVKHNVVDGAGAMKFIFLVVEHDLALVVVVAPLHQSDLILENDDRGGRRFVADDTLTQLQHEKSGALAGEKLVGRGGGLHGFVKKRKKERSLTFNFYSFESR